MMVPQLDMRLPPGERGADERGTFDVRRRAFCHEDAGRSLLHRRRAAE